VLQQLLPGAAPLFNVCHGCRSYRRRHLPSA
jgi:hypothetical protein